MDRRLFPLYCATILVWTLAGVPVASHAAMTGVSPVRRYAPPPILAASAALLDVTANRWLLLDNADEPRAQASTTKIMTALVAVTAGRLDDLAEADAHAVAVGQETGSNMGLAVGERLSLRDLLYGLLLPSGNDAALTIAAHVGGSVPNFVAMMNREAAALGLAHTHFVNPHGLDEPGQYASARDLVLLARQAMQLPLFRQIVDTPSYAILPTTNHRAHALTNLNWFLDWYPGANGVKPGSTGDAGICQVLSAQRNGHWLIGALMRTPDLHTDARDLMNYGFGDFRWAPSGQTGDSPLAAFTAGTPGGPELYVPATGHRIRAGFLDYYQRHGGMSVLGLPLTDEFVENGVTVQYFDRARLWWDEAAQAAIITPLGLAAVPSRLLMRPVAPISDAAHRIYIGATGHTISNGFLAAYRAWGGEDMLGMPLTEELHIGPQTVQYFSNTVLLWTPGRAVTLAPLGSLALRQRGYLLGPASISS